MQVVKLYLAPKEYNAAKLCAGAYKKFIGGTGKVYVSYFMQDAIRKACLYTLKKFGGKQGVQALSKRLTIEVSDEASRMRAMAMQIKKIGLKDIKLKDYLNIYRKTPWLVGKTQDECNQDNWVKAATRRNASGKPQKGLWLFKPWETAETESERIGWLKIRDYRKLRRRKNEQDADSN